MKAMRRRKVWGISAVLGAISVMALAQGKIIFPENADAKAEVQHALAEARREHKRVIVDFGGNWCGDCQVLEIYFHNQTNEPLLKSNYILVPVNIGRYDQNLDLAEKYGIPLKKGVPALVVLDPSGKVVYAQTHGEFEKMRHMDASDVTKFLEAWEPGHKGMSAVL